MTSLNMAIAYMNMGLVIALCGHNKFARGIGAVWWVIWAGIALFDYMAL